MLEQILESTRSFYPELTLTAALCAIILVDLVSRGNRALPALTGIAGTLVTGYFVLTQEPGSGSVFSHMIAVDDFSR